MKHAKLQTVHPYIYPSIYLSVHPAYKQRKRTSKLFPYFQCFRYNCSKYYWPLFPILEFPVNIRKKQGQKCSQIEKKNILLPQRLKKLMLFYTISRLHVCVFVFLFSSFSGRVFSSQFPLTTITNNVRLTLIIKQLRN